MSKFMDTDPLLGTSSSQGEDKGTTTTTTNNNRVLLRHPTLGRSVKRARSLEVSGETGGLHPITEDDYALPSSSRQPAVDRNLVIIGNTTAAAAARRANLPSTSHKGPLLHTSIDEDSDDDLLVEDSGDSSPENQLMSTPQSSLSGDSFVTAVGVCKSRSLGGIIVNAVQPNTQLWTPVSAMSHITSTTTSTGNTACPPTHRVASWTPFGTENEMIVFSHPSKEKPECTTILMEPPTDPYSPKVLVVTSEPTLETAPFDTRLDTSGLHRLRERPHTISADRQSQQQAYSVAGRAMPPMEVFSTDATVAQCGCSRQRMASGTSTTTATSPRPSIPPDSGEPSSCRSFFSNIFFPRAPPPNHYPPSNTSASAEAPQPQPAGKSATPSISATTYAPAPPSSRPKSELSDRILDLFIQKKPVAAMDESNRDYLGHRTGMDDIGVNILRMKGAFPSFMQLQNVGQQRPKGSEQRQVSTYHEPGSLPHNATESSFIMQQHQNNNLFVAQPRSRRMGVVSISTPNLNRTDMSEASTERRPLPNPSGILSASSGLSTPSPSPVVADGSGSGPSRDPEETGSPNVTTQPVKSQRSNSVKPTRNIGWRLGQRKELNDKRRRVSDYALAFAAFGVVCVIFEMEMTSSGIYSKNSPYSYCLKSLTMISTCILVGLIVKYHALEIQLFTVNNCIEDWRIAMTRKRIFRLTVEILVCGIHPPPINVSFMTYLESEKGYSEKLTSLDVVLTVPMVLRLYLIFRVLLLHSSMFTDASSRSIGALNRVKFNIRFILKTLMTICPGKVLLIFILSWWGIGSYIMRTCERIHDPEHHSNLLNSMWLVAITFLSVGYGDLVPHTYCGRSISVITGVMGSCSTALVVAVFARKLELKRAEKHVHNFMMDNKIYKQLRHAAANVLRETWLFYKYTRLVKRVNPGKVRAHQRKFLLAIHSLRRAKESQRKIKEDSSSLVDMAKTQISIFDTVTHVHEEQSSLKERLEMMQMSIHMLQERLDNMPQLLHSLLHCATSSAGVPSEVSPSAPQEPIAVNPLVSSPPQPASHFTPPDKV